MGGEAGGELHHRSPSRGASAQRPNGLSDEMPLILTSERFLAITARAVLLKGQVGKPGDNGLGDAGDR